MRNILALVGAATLTFLGVGWYLGWYEIKNVPAAKATYGPRLVHGPLLLDNSGRKPGPAARCSQQRSRHANRDDGGSGRKRAAQGDTGDGTSRLVAPTLGSGKANRLGIPT